MDEMDLLSRARRLAVMRRMQLGIARGLNQARVQSGRARLRLPTD